MCDTRKKNRKKKRCANIHKLHAESKILHILIFLVTLYILLSQCPSSSSSVNLYTLTE